MQMNLVVQPTNRGK